MPWPVVFVILIALLAVIVVSLRVMSGSPGRVTARPASRGSVVQPAPEPERPVVRVEKYSARQAYSDVSKATVGIKSQGGTPLPEPGVAPREGGRLWQVGKDATRLKKEGNLDAAISALQEQQRLARAQGVFLEAKTLLRLPLYQERAGRFSCALAEFERILRIADTAAEGLGMSNPSATWVAYAAALWRADVYDKMRLACSRQKLQDEAARYTRDCKEQRRAAEKLRKVLDKHRERERAEYEKRRAARQAI